MPDASMETTVEVGGWEHECCGPAIERNDLVDLTCVAVADDHGTVRLRETHHELSEDRDHVQVRGRVVEIGVVGEDDSTEPIQRLPSGRALRGFDEHDDGHLERPWTGEPVMAATDRFVITVDTSG